MRSTTIGTMLLFFLPAILGAGELPSIFGENRDAAQIWPMPESGMEAAVEAAVGEQEKGKVEKKYPARALIFSAAVPGAGQFYAGAKKKGAAFFGAEALAVGLYFAWKNKGDDIEDEFRAMADTSWSVKDYLAWRVTSRAIRNNSFTHALPCSLEVVSGRFDECGGSEKQQYYELLGKYDQFVVGWKDLIDVETGNQVTYTEVDSVEGVYSALRMEYEEKRDDSNKYLKRASNVAGLILINHVISAIDAARTAHARARGADEAALERRIRFWVTLRPWNHGQVPMLMAYKPFD